MASPSPKSDSVPPATSPLPSYSFAPSPPKNSSAPSAPPPSPPPPPQKSTAPSSPPPSTPPETPPSLPPAARSPPPRLHFPPPSHPHSPPPPVPRRTPHPVNPSSIPPPASPISSLGLSARNVAVMGTSVGFLALTLVVLAACLVKGRKKKNKEIDSKDVSNPNDYLAPAPFAPSAPNSAPSSAILRPQISNASTTNLSISSDVMGSSRSSFTYGELSEATDGFSVDKLIGQGGFGSVYIGVLTTDGSLRQVAIKQLKAGSRQGEREFRAEVEIISRIHHKHLVSLVGYCICEEQRLLVYDYVANNTLHYHLHDEGTPVMDWASRVKVAAGAARGLAYLHEDCQPRIIHRDIKSTNILLDDNFEAKVADFGLAKMAMGLNTHVSTRVMGTFGYMAPEYAASGKLTEKSDVYSYGVVLLELITGRMPVDQSQPAGDESLVECARPLLAQALKTQEFDGLVDPRLGSNFIEVEMFRMIEAAAACVRHSASRRPRMSQISRALDSMDELTDPNYGARPGQSGNLDSNEYSSRIRMFDRMALGNEDNSSDFNSRRSQSSWRS